MLQYRDKPQTVLTIKFSKTAGAATLNRKILFARSYVDKLHVLSFFMIHYLNSTKVEVRTVSPWNDATDEHCIK